MAVSLSDSAFFLCHFTRVYDLKEALSGAELRWGDDGINISVIFLQKSVTDAA